MKRMLSVILIVIFIFVLPCESFAIGIENMEAVSVTNNIDQLYAERRRLCMDFDANRDAINAIDQRITQLGVEELSYEEVLSIQGEVALPTATVPISDTTKWTSERVYTVYCGVRMQYQIIRAVPDDPASSLIDSASVSLESEADLIAGNAVLLEAFFETLISKVPVVAETYTVYDIIKNYNETVSTETVVNSIACTYTCSFVAEEKYIYVKYDGAPDADHQFLCYSGNAVEYAVVAAIPGAVEIEGTFTPIVDTVNMSGSVCSEHYDGAVAYAVDMFFYYEYLKQKSLVWDFQLYTFTLNGLGSQHTLSVPTSGEYFNWWI